MRVLCALLLALSCAACRDAVSTSVVVVTDAPDDASYADAVEAARAHDDATALAALGAVLADDASSVQRALLDPAFASLRDERAFRIAVHEASVDHGVASLRLVADDEPGEHIDVAFLVVDPDGDPVADAVVYVFATDADGLYHPTLDGESTPRIFGTVVTDADGRASITTVRPGPYPGTRNPRHLHVDVRAGELRLAVPHYAVFDDDPLLFEPGNEEPRGEAVRIAMDGTSGVVELPVR